MNQDFRFEFHYFLDDNSHKMNAVLKNKADNELFKLINLINDIVGVSVEIEVEANKEGGLRDYITLKSIKKSINGISKNSIAVGIIVGIIVAQYSANEQNKQLQYSLDEQAKLSQLDKIDKNINLYHSLYGEKAELPSELISKLIDSANSNQKVISLTSNFFEKLKSQTKIEKIALTHVDENNKPIFPSQEIHRDNFDNYIIKQKELPSINEYNVNIEIVAPILTTKKANWKGIYNNKSINFRMNDALFTRNVLNKSLSFVNGTYITCDLETFRKINDEGDIEMYEYVVTNVVGTFDSTHQKIIRNNSNGNRGNQLTLNFK